MKGKALLAVLLAGVSIGLGWAAPTQRSVVPGWLKEEALYWQVLSPTSQVPVETVVLWYTEDPTSEHLAQLEDGGYTILGVVGRMVTVAAPVTLFIDPEKGLDSLGFSGLVLPNFLLSSSTSLFVKPLQVPWPVSFKLHVFCY